MSIYEKLTNLQNELKAPKNQRNSFGKYNYRSAEDILETVKPLLQEYNLSQIISDEIELIGNRYYVKATIILIDIEDNKKIIVSAYARESETKKGMDESQITGATSSYARKYALSGLYAIDDNKDADTDEYQKTTNTNTNKNESKKASDKDIKDFFDFIDGQNLNTKQVQAKAKTVTGKTQSKDWTDSDLQNLYIAFAPTIGG